MDALLTKLAASGPSIPELIVIYLGASICFRWWVLAWNQELLRTDAPDNYSPVPMIVLMGLAVSFSFPFTLVTIFFLGRVKKWVEATYGEYAYNPKEKIEEIYAQIKGQRDFGWRWNVSFTVLRLLVIGPIVEEFCFRAPLRLFAPFNIWSILAIIISTGIFSGMHYYAHIGIVVEELRARRENREPQISQMGRITSAFLTFVLGLACSFVTVYYQSLWVAVLIHVTWNTLSISVYRVIIKFKPKNQLQ